MDRGGDETRVARLRLIVEALPPREREGRETEFGLQDRDQGLHAGQEQADGTVRFELEVPARWNARVEAPRFGGPFAQGPPDAPFLYLSWKWEGLPPEWIRRQKIPLGAITWEEMERAAARRGVFETTVPPITERTASIPVEWQLTTPAS